MKYIKTYESLKENTKYWKMPINEPHLTIALKKLQVKYNCDITIHDLYHNYISSKKSKFGKELYIICIDFYSEKTNQMEKFWYWDSPNLLSKIKYKHYKNMGKVEVTDEDVEQFNIEKTSNKYNI